jgi:hypothetical protein
MSLPWGEAFETVWAHDKGRVLQGGFSERLMLERLPPKSEAAKRADHGW